MGLYAQLFIFVFMLFFPKSLCGNAKLFKDYIGAEFLNVKFSDVPINNEVEFHFILSFAIDYTEAAHSPTPTNGKFSVFWDEENLSPADVLAVKSKHKNVKVAVSLGGAVVGDDDTAVQFQPSSVSSWVNNAVSTLSPIITEYHIDGIDIDYENFDHANPAVFADCVGQLIIHLKQKKLISTASIAPFEDEGSVQTHYQTLWKKYGRFIDHVNFQFYSYDEGTTVKDFLKYYDTQASNYKGGKILASFATDTSAGGLKPENGFFEACKELKNSGKLEGIFIWSADDSKKNRFIYEEQSQALLAS